MAEMAGAELSDDSEGGPKAGDTDVRLRKARAESWTKDKRAAFLAHLAETANVTGALRVVGMGSTGLYKLRQRDAGFRAAWDQALAEGYQRLELVALERALGGTRTPIIHGGKQTGEAMMPDNKMVMFLLQMHRQSVKGARDLAVGDPEIVCAELEAKLTLMHKRLTDGQ
ncbi:hypothetical protein SAMN06295912_10260 [Sphingomonas laterariae]|uniref:Terminase small subunit n=1 Tax=Edaphosphingomonas laterariae TaxID=861865 RepID=A0A239CAH1_9SPHN|nr:hypothetical protein [Sphingomonas laterariae]SNS16353.1 hypothetical protein SAMN06295912_10260 [Sphingomonas laterariae]